MKLRRLCLAGLACLCAGLGFSTEAQSKMKLHWTGVAPAPEKVARPFAGMMKVGDKQTLVLAGGSMHDGTTKTYSAKISLYDTQANTWTVLDKTLPQPTAEGSAVVVKEGLLCVGGVTPTGATSAAYLLKGDGTIETLPNLTDKDGSPLTLSMAASAPWGEGAIFATGLLNGTPTNRAFSLAKKDGVWTWTELDPLPGPARTQAVGATQNGDQKTPIFVVYGGSVKNAQGIDEASTEGYGYAKNFDGQPVWKKLECDAPVSTIGATFTTIGDQHMLLIGGYNAEVWNHVNTQLATAPTPEAKAAVTQWLATAPIEDFKWNREVFAYHAVTGKWTKYGTLSDDTQTRCGAVAAIIPADLKGDAMPRVLLVGGEVKPAQRTDAASIVNFERNDWNFSTQSWIVIGVYFLAMVAMATVFIMRQKNAGEDFLRGSKSIPWYVAGMSIFATMLSSITFISIPTMTYIGDWRYFPMVVCIFILAPIAIYFYLPFFCRLNITSAYEYLEKRFNVAIRLFGSGVFNIFMVCRVAVVVLLPALALDAVTGMGVEVCILICGVATIIYCSLGGLDAVIWSDFFQGIVLLGGAIAVLCILIANTDGGFGGFVEIAQNHEKLRILDFRFLFSEPVFWVVVIQGLVGNLSSYTSDQCVIQRYIACTNEKKAASSIWFNGALSVIASVIFYAIGTALYTHYFSSPEMMDVTMPKSDSVFPIFMAMELNPYIAGLVIAAIFAATISTLSANLTSASTAITTDFVARFKPNMTGAQKVTCGRICIIVVGILGVGAALTLAQLPTRSLFDEFQKFIAMLTAGLTALFFMGIFMPRVGGIPAIVGLIANYIVCYGLDLIPATSSLAVYKPHPFVYGGIGLVVCIIVAWILSFVLPNERSTEGLTHFSKPKGEDEA